MRDWKPLYPNHAIQQVTAGIQFRESLPDRPWRQVQSKTRDIGRRSGLITEHPVHEFRMAIDPGHPEMSSSQPTEIGLEMVRFERPDFFSEKVTVDRNSIVFENWRYSRWAGFQKQLQELVIPLAEMYTPLLDVANVYIEYIDRFDSKELGNQPDCGQVISSSSKFIAEKAYCSSKPWHCHVGYFDDAIQSTRRLVNVDVDVADLSVPHQADHLRAIRVRTRLTDWFGVPQVESLPEGAITKEFIVERFDMLHIELKALLSAILTEEAAGDISLQRGS